MMISSKDLIQKSHSHLYTNASYLFSKINSLYWNFQYRWNNQSSQWNFICQHGNVVYIQKCNKLRSHANLHPHIFHQISLNFLYLSSSKKKYLRSTWVSTQQAACVHFRTLFIWQCFHHHLVPDVLIPLKCSWRKCWSLNKQSVFNCWRSHSLFLSLSIMKSARPKVLIYHQHWAAIMVRMLLKELSC